MKCKVCNNTTNKIFEKKVLSKYDVSYYQCNSCNFVQTEDPYWLEEAYGSGAIGALDVGIMTRNIQLVKQTDAILRSIFKDFTNFSAVDFGGAQGVFVRMMRDLGYNFFRQDLYAENLYAKYFDVLDLPNNHKFDILTAFEVFEHLPNPLEEINEMFKLSDVILFSTELIPSNDIGQLEKWWYIVPEGGQHVSFYSKDTFLRIAEDLNGHFYTNSSNLHILSKKELIFDPFATQRITKNNMTLFQKLIKWLDNRVNRTQNNNLSENKKLKSLMMSDFDFIKEKHSIHED
jgi:2-polyprenyl-3-methyl-5-hydroxy-6-metoxy-1,4-benzoquinol methylase